MTAKCHKMTYSQYLLNCNGNYPDMVFKIGGIDYYVPAYEYLLDVSDVPRVIALACRISTNSGKNDEIKHSLNTILTKLCIFPLF